MGHSVIRKDDVEKEEKIRYIKFRNRITELCFQSCPVTEEQQIDIHMILYRMSHPLIENMLVTICCAAAIQMSVQFM